MNNKIIEVHNVRKTFKDLVALDSLNFEVEQSTCFALLGPNGAGKTTMMKMIYGKCRRDIVSGSSINVFGYDPNIQELNIKYISGVVPQENDIDQGLNVKENLQIFTNFYGISSKRSEERISTLLDFMELSDKKSSKIKELSGGMKRRLLIVRALLNDPKLLILDEPTTGLDPQVRHLIWNKIRQLKKNGTTILLTTHYMEEAFNLADNILILHEGKKILEGNPRELLNESMEDYVLEIMDKNAISSINSLVSETSVRKEEEHDIYMLYSNNIMELKKISENLNEGKYYLRQSNLEDLFLKMTGRKLHERQ